jgi:iron complex transport system ATP-binding protein
VPPHDHTDAPVALDFSRVLVWEHRDGRHVNILEGVDWRVRAAEHWAVIGPNGAGKSTLLAVAAGARHPARGTVHILGGQLGRVDVRELRTRIGQVNPRLEYSFQPARTVQDVVLSGATGSVAVLADRVTGEQAGRSRRLLALVGCAHLAGQRFSHCSEGERRRVVGARALLPDPDLLLLDEPAAGLDLPGREALIAALAAIAAERPETAIVQVAHHLEELPATVTHALLLREGRAVAAGPAADVLTSAALSDCFGTAIDVRRDDSRWTARARPAW